MNEFLCGPPFAGVSRAFGGPSVRLWSVWRSLVAPGAIGASHATQEVLPIVAHEALDRFRDVEIAAGDEAMADGALAAVAGFDPTAWTIVRFRLWNSVPDRRDDTVQHYDVGYVSVPGAPR